MSIRHLRPWLVPCFLALGVLAFASGIQGQVPVPPIKPNPLAPTLNPAVPLGMQRGTTLDLTLTGVNLAGPTKVWTSFPAKVTIPTDMNNGKDNTKLRVRLEVPKDAGLGYHTIRLATTRGLSNFSLFCIDDLPQIMEGNNNHSKTTAQPISVPSVVIGRCDAEMSDYFKIRVKAGQRLSFDVLGRRLGSAFDPQISLYDAKSGRELPDGYSNDAPGCQTDPRISYTFKEAGDYLVEVRDVMYSGGPNFWYRLRIGDFPCATSPMPMAAKRGSKVKVSFAGPNVKGVEPVEVTTPSDAAINTVWVAPKGANGLYGWPVALAVSDHEEVLEKEPNNEPARANRIPVPGGISARFQEKGDVDHFVFAAKKGQRYVIEAHSLELYSPTEVYMVLKDAKGGQLLATNPVLPPRLEFTAPAEGDYTLVMEHLLYWGGPSETYRVTVTPAQADFSLSVGIDRFDVPQGAVAAASIMALRRGYTGAIEVSVVGPKGITGKATINAGQPAAPNLPAALLLIHAQADTAVGAYPIVIQGKATIDGKTIVRYASVRTVVAQNLANLPYPPRHLNNQIGVAVTEKPPFTLSVKLDQPEVVRGLPATVTVTAVRATGFVDDIVLMPFNFPPNVVPVVKNIVKNHNTAQIALNTNLNAPLGNFAISFTGKAKFQNREFLATASPGSLVIATPFALKVEPVPFKVTQGTKAKIKITAERKGGYKGPITLLVRNLPANVTAVGATIAAGQTAAEIEISAAPTAAPASKADVNILGTATAAANQQQASANFTVTVLKK